MKLIKMDAINKSGKHYELLQQAIQLQLSSCEKEYRERLLKEAEWWEKYFQQSGIYFLSGAGRETEVVEHIASLRAEGVKDA